MITLMYLYLVALILGSYFVNHDLKLFRMMHFDYFDANTNKF